MTEFRTAIVGKVEFPGQSQLLMTRQYCITLLIAVSLSARAQPPTVPLSAQREVRPLESIQQLVLPPIDAAGERAADASKGIETPLRFAVSHTLRVTPATDGTWESLPEGRLWRLRISSAGATNLNLGFSRYWLPAGATLHISSETAAYFQGPYTSRHNKPHGQLWTGVVPGDRAVIELFVPAQSKEEPQLTLSQVGAGYRDLFRLPQGGPAPEAESSCNVDVACPIAAPWTNEIRSVGLYTISGAWTCSGALIADAAGDFRNYFLTANHCGLNSGNAPSVVVYWNFQSTNCGTHGPGSLAQNQSGAIFRAARYDVDFALIELEDIPDAAFRVYYSGWDRSGVAPAGGVGIHHPAWDVKAISFSSNAVTTVNNCIGPITTNTHWQVVWSLGITEGGSSGSGLWDPANHKLVGTLSGGGVSCSTPTYPDCYGKLSVAWDGGSPAERLRDWLDAQNTGVASVAGVDPMLTVILAPAGGSLVTESCLPTNNAIDPGESVSVSLAVQNFGGVATTDLVATLLPSGGVSLPGQAQHYGSVGGGASVSRTFTFTAGGYCGGTLSPTLQLQDGPRNLGTAAFDFILGAPTPVRIVSEDFDEVNAPGLPAGWATSVTAGGTAWAVSSAQADTPPNSVFAPDASFVADNSLVSPPLFIHTAGAQVSFRHSYNVEAGYDGGVLEISRDGGAFTDIVTAGGGFASNGYNQTLSLYYRNPLAGRPAWSGNSGGFINTIASLPADDAGHNVQLRWRFGSDSSYGLTGWYVDSVSVSEPGYVCCGSLTPPALFNLRTVGNGTLAFSYDALTGQIYYLETTTQPGPGGWTVLQTNSGNSSRLSFTNASNFGNHFFRLRSQ